MVRSRGLTPFRIRHRNSERGHLVSNQFREYSSFGERSLVAALLGTEFVCGKHVKILVNNNTPLPLCFSQLPFYRNGSPFTLPKYVVSYLKSMRPNGPTLSLGLLRTFRFSPRSQDRDATRIRSSRMPESSWRCQNDQDHACFTKKTAGSWEEIRASTKEDQSWARTGKAEEQLPGRLLEARLMGLRQLPGDSDPGPARVLSIPRKSADRRSIRE
jgi:hypothetical protein